MNDQGFIYILGNDCLVPGLYKIGLTKQSPEKRASILSQSTSIAGKFEVLHFRKVNHVVEAEKMIHLLLSDCRYSQNKEFYLVDIKRAKKMIERVVRYIDTENFIGDSIGIREELIYANYTIKQNVNDMKIIRMLFAGSNQNTIFDTISNTKIDIIQGFINSKQIADFLAIQTNRACKIMHDFVKNHAQTELKLTNGNIKVFEEIKYSRGLLAWIFDDQFRKLFINYKIIE
ncbi:MAG: GIY-YIG nuclease family protein [Syntrophomonas sp.]